MSVTNSSDSEKPCVDAHERQEDVKDDDEKKDSSFLSGSSRDKSAIKRALKEVGLTSTTFIGPEFPTDSAKSNIDDTLEEFYKEIEMIDKPKAAEDNSEKKVDFVQPQPPPLASTAKKCKDRNMGNKPFDNQQHEGRRPSSWPHWYQNEPYFHRGPRDHMDLMHSAASNQSHFDHPEMINRPRPRDSRHPIPPFHHLTAFPYPQNPSHENYRGGASTETVPHPHFPRPQNIPPPHIRCHSSQLPFRDSPQDCSFFTHAGDNGNTGLPTFRKQEWCHGYEGYDLRGYSRDSENQLWNRHRQTPDDVNGYHSKLVLILMRGLPGSGKSTLAREMIFSCPDGLIFSTDDYFAHRDGYCYDPGLLGEAHEWNQTRGCYTSSDLFICSCYCSV
uniref:NEDD4 binding protein 2-like 2 n=1 Tax=Takifugu rubripes TaxID=31033 RepID=A0A3B5KA96_TAKRU